MRAFEDAVFAHSVPGRPVQDWERLAAHLHAVGAASGRFGEEFGCGALAALAGLLHDIGKSSPAFQRYIAQAGRDDRARGPDHSTAGAVEVQRLVPGPLGRILAGVIAGHHAGLPDGPRLAERLAKTTEPYDGWRSHAGPLPSGERLGRTKAPEANPERGFERATLARMLFSCLVDADRLETAAFYARAEGRDDDRMLGTALPALRDRLRVFMARLGGAAGAAAGAGTQARLNALRSEILDHATAKAALPPGLFTLTVPTGGGKTLASLSFALEHAARNDLRRVVYVIPFTSIIEQTAAVFRAALGPTVDTPNDQDVLEHHATFDWDALLRSAGEDGRGAAPVERLQRAAESWDAPVVVTTAVQFFESLFSNRPSACRKLHNLARSVIVLDEAQILPLRILRPCLAILDELARNYGASVVICTATQPAWRKLDGRLVERLGGGRPGRNLGLDIPLERELAPDPERLFRDLKRVEVDYRSEPIGDEEIAERFAQQPQMLCIVNSRRHAKALFERIAGLRGSVHLSTWMCPRHRRLVLEEARADLKDKAEKPVRIVSTSLIEAGVDIDLPEVWRAAAGLDSLLQAAGRCNREFRLAAGRLVIFLPVEDRAPHDLRQAWDAGRAVLRRRPDPQTIAAISAYFGELYGNRGVEALDASKLGAGPDRALFPILRAIRERADTCDFPFASIAEAFRVIEDVMEPVVVPWSSGPDDSDAETLLARIAATDTPRRGDLRRLQQYTVPIPKAQRDAWLAQGVLTPVHPALGEAALRFADLALYDPRSGLRVDEPDRRAPESNVM